VNGVPKSTTGTSFTYADDTSILNVRDNLAELENVTYTNTNKVTQYFEANNLFTNFSKTNFILCQIKQRRDASELSVVIKNKEIREENYQLSWCNHRPQSDM
jgi:hypothetical protein